ncbi:MAG TPA: DinB family protein [Paludibacter sp.]|nr:DinB family protein [Paludibacter sp.]
MKKSDILEMPEYFDRYINLVPDKELDEAFMDSLKQINELEMGILNNLEYKSYQPEKWTVKEILQHITDIERLLCAGVLQFARNNNTYTISFDENEISKNSKANKKNILQIIAELISVRKATISLYESFDNEDLLKTGINWKHRISILAMGFNIIGHQIHHLNVIKEKYYPLFICSAIPSAINLFHNAGMSFPA